MSKGNFVSFKLASGCKLGVEIAPPKDGIIHGGLRVNKVQNPSLIQRNISRGDILLEIGGQTLDGMRFADAANLIKTLPRPLALKFEIVKESLKKQARAKEFECIDENIASYNVVFDSSNTGLTLEDGIRFGIDGAVVQEVRGFAKNAGITPGDIVYKVNQTEVLFMPLQEVQKLIKSLGSLGSIDFIPKNNLENVQRMNLTMSVAEKKVRIVRARSMSNASEIKNASEKPIEEVMRENRSTVAHKGLLYIQGQPIHHWEQRHVILTLTQLEYFENANDSESLAVLSFENDHCSVHSMQAVHAKMFQAPTPYLIQVKAGDDNCILACATDEERKYWVEAIKIAIGFCRVLNQEASVSEAPHEGNTPLANIPEVTFTHRGEPVVEIEILSVHNLPRKKNVFHMVNPYCKVTLGSRSFKTPVKKETLNPRWTDHNKAVLDVPSMESLIEIGVFDHRVIRGSESIFTFTIPVQLLPRNTEIHQVYSISLEDQSSDIKITLKALLHCNDMPPDPPSLIQAKSQLDMEKAQLDEIALAADREAAFADRIAQQAQELANALIQEAKEKAEQAIAAAKDQALGEAAAAEAARAEARLAQERADAQINEAKKAQAEAQNIIQRSKLIRQKSIASGTSHFSSFVRYRAMLNDKTPEEEVKQQMLAEGIDKEVVDEFLENTRGYQQRLRDLESEVNTLKRDNDVKRKQQSESTQNEELDQLPKDTLIRRYLQVIKQLQQNGITVAEDIPYEEAKRKIEEISKRMMEMDSSDVKNPEYFQLEKDMERYTAALLLSDEYIAEEARKEQEWEDQHREANEAALKAIRRMMPVNVKNMTTAQLLAEVTPNGKRMTEEVVRKFKRTNVLEILRTDPQVLFKGHPGIVARFNLVGLTVTERQALHLHLREIGEKWKTMQDNEMMAKKYTWYKSLKDAFKAAFDAYNRHVAQYGPPGNHPYATRDFNGVGCPLLGKQCPLKANALPAYNQDWGYPEGPVYEESPTIIKTGVDDGAKQIQEEKERLFKAKAADARSQQREQSLKAHYATSRGALVLVKAANGAIENMEELLDKIEADQMKWFKRILDGTATSKAEVDDWQSLLSEIRLSTIGFAERSGMHLAGVRNPEKYSRDTRSRIEILYCNLVCDAVLDCFRGMDERMKQNSFAEEKRLRGDIGAMTEILQELHERGTTTLSTLQDESSIPRQLKPRSVLLSKVKEDIRKEKAAAAPPVVAAVPERPPHPLLGGRGRGRGNPLLDAINKRAKKLDNDQGNDNDTASTRPVNPLFAAIEARRKAEDTPPVNPLFAAIAARRKVASDE